MRLRFRSLRLLVVALAGACLLAVTAALVGYSLVSASRTQDVVAEHTQSLLESGIDERLSSLAHAEAERIRNELDRALTLASQLAHTNALMGMPGDDGRSQLRLSREELSNLVRHTVVENPGLLDAYIGWEPDAFDADARYAGRETGFADGSGRFRPWWVREADGSMRLGALNEENMESEAPLGNGMRRGEYYLCPRDTLAPCIIDPAAYDYAGVMRMVTSFNVPIVVEGEFRGIAGVDMSVDFTQEFLTQANQGLYDGAGEMALIASLGSVAAYTADNGSLGEAAGQVMGDAVQQRILEAQRSGEMQRIEDADGMLELYLPFSVSDDQAPWVLLTRLPREVVLAELGALQRTLGDQRRQHLWGMGLVGLLVAGLGLVAIWLVGGGIARPLRELAGRMREIASGDGDLTQRLPVEGRDESAELAIQFNAFADKIHDVLLKVRVSSEAVRVAATEIASGGQDLSRRTETAAASLQQTSASMEEITSTVEHTAESAREANDLSQSASEVAARGGEVVSRVVSTMDEITGASRQIAEIVTVMDGIAFQTNLLALNASVEAARAGEQGRGFAVVAGEVRQLASRSAAAAREVKALIDASETKVRSGSELVSQAGATMNEIVTSVSRVSDVLQQITAATGEQSDGIGQVNVAVAELDRMTQENAALVEESSAAAERLEEQSLRLAEVVGAFTLADSTSRAPLWTPAALPAATAPRSEESAF
ncbi:methyl-accepting chemotaxis protein [Billgrantia bachuensis]|uniref:HAMP domain-containing protein n=1 Tax=Billgrantia bachuensis TaxID=2717286 RepID=A0ABX0PR73_9GAMM|nr:methyl-accepting chemotaxis protein [Halomonas bachuensis]NIC05621.1 HAMP domain-containing protein [Halomonas bachuensis]